MSKFLRILESAWIVPAFVLSIIIAMSIVFAYEERQQVLESKYAILETHARIADSQLAGLLRHLRESLKQAAAEGAGTPLDKIKQELPEIRALVILNAAGRVESTINPSFQGLDSSDREYFTVHRDQILASNFHISRPFKSRFGDYSIVFSVAIRDDQQRFLGVVAAGVNYQLFEDLIPQIMAPDRKADIAAILNPHGDLLYRTPDPKKYAGVNVANAAHFQNYIKAQQPVHRSIGFARTDGIERLYVYRAIGQTGLSVVIGHPLDHALAGWWRNVMLRTLIVALVITVTLFLVWRVRLRQRLLAAMATIQRDADVARRLVVIQEEERRRLAVELHDRTSPNLSALAIHWKLFTDTAHAPAAARTSLLNDVSALIDDTVESIRDISTEFHPPQLLQADFWPIIEGYTQHFSRRTGITVEAERPAPKLHLPPETRINLFRIVQEALTNCAKHSRAKTVNIGQIVDGDYIRLTIADDGAGFDPDNPPAHGHGLRTMQSRAEFIGGRFSLVSRPGSGTRIAVEVKVTDFLWQAERQELSTC